MALGWLPTVGLVVRVGWLWLPGGGRWGIVQQFCVDPGSSCSGGTAGAATKFLTAGQRPRPSWTQSFLSGRCPAADCLRFKVEFQQFLTAVSVWPFRSLPMVAHLLPCSTGAWMMILSSSGVKGRWSTSGESWLHHRFWQDMPDLPGMDLITSCQFRGLCR